MWLTISWCALDDSGLWELEGLVTVEHEQGREGVVIPLPLLLHLPRHHQSTLKDGCVHRRDVRQVLIGSQLTYDLSRPLNLGVNE